MTTITNVSSAAGSSATSAASSSTATAKDLASSQDRFLKLLVAQLNNQDPMNPMDNAQMTSQIAQINTVTGIQQVNETLKGISMFQGTTMVGHSVLLEGSRLPIIDGVAGGAIDLPSDASSVKVNILSPSGSVVGAVDLGAQTAGRTQFEWDASGYNGGTPLSFSVVAKNGNTALTTTSLVRDKVTSVGSDNGVMNVQLQGNAKVPYSNIKAIL